MGWNGAFSGLLHLMYLKTDNEDFKGEISPMGEIYEFIILGRKFFIITPLFVL